MHAKMVRPWTYDHESANTQRNQLTQPFDAVFGGADNGEALKELER